MKVIFLDFDGVLVTDNHDDHLELAGEKRTDWFGRKFVPPCVAALEQIVLKTSAGIVITSSWRHAYSIMKMK